ncbi:hypothetical protein AGMMS49531_07570 [Endomicrobiia bacterium]|nr:hypothetical protein AGMMS49531_07570 [Endomicrobiia bacterium]
MFESDMVYERKFVINEEAIVRYMLTDKQILILKIIIASPTNIQIVMVELYSTKL